MADLSWTCWLGIALLVAMLVVSAVVFICGLARACFPRNERQDDQMPPFA